MICAVVCAVLAQAPQPLPLRLVVIQGSNLGVAPARAAELTRTVIELARLEGMDAAAVEAPCSGQQCLVEAARENGADAVVSVTFAALGKDAVMDLDCRTAGTGEVIAQSTLTVRAATQAELVFEHLPFLRRVKRLLSGEELQGAVEAPKPVEPPKPVESPKPVEPPPAATATPRRSPLPYITGAASLALAVAGVSTFAFNASEHLSVNPDGTLRSYEVPRAVAFDERNMLAIWLLVGAGAALALTIVVALIQ